MVPLDNLWMVKSSGRILGPFPSPKIIELLRTREISVLDEISSPLRRWQTIQYHGEFKDTIDSMRKANLSEKTEATWTPTGATSNLTLTLTDLSGGELTDEIGADSLNSTHAPKEIVVHDVQELLPPAPAPPGGRYQTQGSHSTAIQRQVEKTTRGLWAVTVLVLVAVAVFILQKRMSHGGFEMRPSLSTLRQAVMANVQTGQYPEALRELKAFYPDPGQAGDMAIYYGALLIQVEGQTLMGRRLLNSVIATHRSEAKQAYSGLGVADLLDGQLDSAQENFDRALSLDSSYPPAMVNAAAVALQRREFGRAKTLSLKVLQTSPLQGEALLILAESQLALFSANNNSTDLNQVSRTLQDANRKIWDYASELGFYGLYFDFLKSDRMLDDKIRDYLDRDPQLTADHRHSLFTYRGHAQWKLLGRLCEKMVGKLESTARVAALQASCLGHEQRWEQARRSIERAVQQSPKDALIQAWFSYILKENGEGDQASVVLGRASELNRRGEYILPILLQARFCAALGDVDCAKDSWAQLYERDLDHLSAVSGLAWVNAQKGGQTEAAKLLDKGLRISPDYIPLLLLRQKAEKEGWYAAK